MKQIDSDIKTNSYKRAYIIFGDESYLVRRYTEKLRSALSSGDFAMMNTALFDGKDCSVNKIADSVQTAPFGSDYRLVEVRDSGFFSPGKKDASDAMAKLMSNIPDSTVILFSLEKVDKRNSLYKAVKKYGYCCEINKLSDKELIGYVREFSGGRLNTSLAEYLVKNTGDNLEVLAAETDKLLNYAGSKKITKEDIDAACTKSLETRIFDMVAAIGSKNADRALDIYSNLLLQKESPFGINKMIARQFRLILQCLYVYKRSKCSNAQIAAELGLREFIVRDCMRQSANFDLPTLMQAVRDCAQTDADIKKGLADAAMGVEMLILKYSR